MSGAGRIRHLESNQNNQLGTGKINHNQFNKPLIGKFMQRKGFYMSRRFPIGLLLLKKLKVALLILMPHFFILLLGGKEHERNQSRPYFD